LRRFTPRFEPSFTEDRMNTNRRPKRVDAARVLLGLLVVMGIIAAALLLVSLAR
jgi:hypothetical protein